MSSTAEPHPPSKKRKDAEEVIVIESDEEESLPPLSLSPTLEVVDLQEKLLRKDNMYKRACRAARQAELRAEFAENIIDSKRDVINGARMEMDADSKKKLEELAAQSEFAKNRVDVASKYNISLLSENVKLRGTMLEDKVKYDLQNIILEELHKKNAELTRENKALKRQCKSFEESQMRDRSKNAELLIKLAKLEKSEQLSQPVVDPTMPVGQALKMNMRSTKGQVAAPPQVNDAADPINIFKLCNTNTTDAISLNVAAARIRLKCANDAMEKWRNYCKDSDEGLECEVCKIVVSKGDIFTHFLTLRHVKLVRARDAAVSHLAMQHWLGELQKATDVDAAAAAPAASAAALTELQKVTATLAESPASPEPEDKGGDGEEDDNISVEI